MQIPSSQWTSAASSAIPQQISKQTGSATSSTAPTTAIGIEQVAQGDQTQDRDADEKYDGQGRQNPKSLPHQTNDANSTSSQSRAIELAAQDPEPPSSFESWG